jgi:adenylyl-sulfate kinase
MPGLAELTDYSLAVGSLSQGWPAGLAPALVSGFRPGHIDHPGMTVWFTGLSGSGKSTISQAVYRELAVTGHRVDLLDGDEVRLFLSRDLTFSKQDRDENVRRIGYVAELLTRNGVITLVSAISPYRDAREQVRTRIPSFLEVYVNASIEECERRDVKGLYKRARAGHIKAFTGISDPYEAPQLPEIECRTDLESVTESVQKVVRAITSRIRVDGPQPSAVI